MKLAGWVDSAASRTAEQAIALLRAIPGGPRIQIPIRCVGSPPSPVQRDFPNEVINRGIDRAPIRRVAIASLVSAQQHTVARNRVESYIKKPDLIPKNAHHKVHGGPIDLPIVIRYQQLNWLYDGHHRTMAAVLLGERTIRCRYVDLDAVKSRA